MNQLSNLFHSQEIGLNMNLIRNEGEVKCICRDD